MPEIIIKNQPDKDPGPERRSRMEAAVVAILTQSGVPADQLDECFEWAFGKGALYVPIFPDWVDRWHKLHPRAFRVKPHEKFLEFIYVVGFMFCVHKKKEAMRHGGE
jgi:hypothetical protein